MARTIKTFTGRIVDPFCLKAEDIDIVDIAHALSNICRFNGHCNKFYSVAQHCVLVAELSSLENKMAALLHDASEAYLCDIPGPIKHSAEFQDYRGFERDVQERIYNKFGLFSPIPSEVKEMDKAAVVAEGVQLMNELYSGLGPPAEVILEPWAPSRAKKNFLGYYRSILLTGGIAVPQVEIQH